MAEQRMNNKYLIDELDMRTDEDESIDLAELFLRLLGNWKLILTVAVLFALVAGVFTTYFVTPLYRATATIYVVSSRDSAINISDITLGTALTTDYLKVFKTWEVQAQVADNLNLPYSYGQLRGMLSVSNEKDTRMLDISITSPDPEEAAMLANEYANVGRQYIADAMSTERPNIMSVALVPTSPVSPNRSRNVIMAFAAGLILTSAIILLFALLNDRYKSAEEIRRITGLTTLAVIPIEDSVKKRGR